MFSRKAIFTTIFFAWPSLSIAHSLTATTTKTLGTIQCNGRSAQVDDSSTINLKIKILNFNPYEDEDSFEKRVRLKVENFSINKSLLFDPQEISAQIPEIGKTEDPLIIEGQSNSGLKYFLKLNTLKAEMKSFEDLELSITRRQFRFSGQAKIEFQKGRPLNDYILNCHLQQILKYDFFETIYSVDKEGFIRDANHELLKMTHEGAEAACASYGLQLPSLKQLLKWYQFKIEQTPRPFLGLRKRDRLEATEQAEVIAQNPNGKKDHFYLYSDNAPKTQSIDDSRRLIFSHSLWTSSRYSNYSSSSNGAFWILGNSCSDDGDGDGDGDDYPCWRYTAESKYAVRCVSKDSR